MSERPPNSSEQNLDQLRKRLEKQYPDPDQRIQKLIAFMRRSVTRTSTNPPALDALIDEDE